MMSNVKEAFDNLLNTIAAETERKFNELDQKIKDKRIAQLEKDLAELQNRKDKKEPNTTKE